MCPTIRVDKLHPDGSPRASWQGYRIPDSEGAVRIWTPAHTPRVHVNGRWTPDSPIVTAWVPGERFVTHCYQGPEGLGLYIDIVRDCDVTPSRFAYVDLYVDVSLWKGDVTSKDEEFLAKLAPDEAQAVLVTRDLLLRSVRSAEAPFRLGDPRWRVPDSARALPPGTELELELELS